MEYGVNVGIFGSEVVRTRLYPRVAVVDIALGINFVAVGIVEIPCERPDLVGGILLGCGAAGVNLGKLESNYVMPEVPRGKARREFGGAHGIAQGVLIVSAIHQVQVRVDFDIVGYGRHHLAVFGVDVDVNVGVYFAVKDLDAHVLAIGRHHSVAYHDVNDEYSAVNRDVLPVHVRPGQRGEYLVLPVDVRIAVAVRRQSVRGNRVPVHAVVRRRVPVKIGGILHAVSENASEIRHVLAAARIDVAFFVIEHGAAVDALYDFSRGFVGDRLYEITHISIRRGVEIEGLSVSGGRESIYRRGSHHRFGYEVVGVGGLLVGNAYLDFILTEVRVEQLLLQFFALYQIIVAVGVIKDPFLAVGDYVPAGFPHAEIVHDVDPAAVLILFIIIRHVLVKPFPYPVVTEIGTESDNVHVVVQIVNDFVPFVVQNGIVSRGNVVNGVQIEVRGIVLCHVIVAVISENGVGYRLQRLPGIIVAVQ